MNEQIILLHGIARSRHHMRKLATFLEKNNYTIYNLDYPSTELNLEGLVENLHKQVEKHLDTNQVTHFIGYSMGGLLTRMYLNKYKVKNLGKVIQLATPNNGSEIANLFRNNWLYKKIYGLAGQQLTTNQNKISHLLEDKIDYPLGIVAGNFCLDPFCYFLIPKPHDGKVSVQSTKLKGMKDHTVIKSCHTFFPHNKQVHKATLKFLKTTNFDN